MYDIQLLKLVGKRDHYNQFKDVISKSNVSKVTNDIFEALESYYTSFPEVEEVDWEKYRVHFNMFHLKHKKDFHEYSKAFDSIIKEKFDETMEKALYKHFLTVDYATRLNVEAAKVAMGQKGASKDTIRELVDKWDHDESRVDIAVPFTPPNLDYLAAALSGTSGYQWRLEEFNISLGPARQGDFILVGARVETGKTTLILSEATFMLPQIPKDRYVILVNNEEASEKVMARAIQSHAGVTLSDLMGSRALYESAWLSDGGDRFLIVDPDSGYDNVPRLNSLFKRYKPGLIIFDQLDKVKGFWHEKEQYARLGLIYQWARDTSKKYCPVIAVSQLDASAEGVKYPGMETLRGSKTDKPGEADAIILLGNEKDGTLKRWINIDKNKMLGGPRTLEAHRHGKFEIEIVPHKARYLSKWTTK